MARMRVLVLGGLGSAGKRHVAGWQAAGWDVAVADRNDNWNPAGCDAISIATPDMFHVEQSIRALEAGRHVFCEKPVCHTAGDYAEIFAAVKARPGLFGVCLPLRRKGLPPDSRRPYLIEGEYLYGRRTKFLNGWRGAYPEYSIVCGGGIHLVDQMTWRLGEPLDVLGVAVGQVASVGLLGWTDCIGRLTVDFGWEGQHRAALYISDVDGRSPVAFTEQGGIEWAVQQFADEVETGRPHNGESVLVSQKVCLKLAGRL